MATRWLQRMAFGRRQRRTEARQCIADVLMRQQTLERQLVSASACSHPISFEDLCVRAGVGDIQSFGPTDRPSCGHTLQCWASIFLSAPQITRTSLYQLIAGGPIIQAFNNANVVLHAARHMFESMSMTQLPNVMLALARGYCQSAAISGERRLRATLMEEEHACDLPRVLFCSMSWVTVQRVQPSTDHRQHSSAAGPAAGGGAIAII